MQTTLCLIVKDAADHLEACVNSFKGLFAEIVIVDTGSKDNTKKIARSLSATVFDYKWKNDFSAARNFALSKVKTDWVLVVDADDMLDKKDNKALIKALKNIDKNSYIISCPYVYSKEKDSGMGQISYRTRFWKTVLNLKYIYPVHELLEIPPQYAQNIKKIAVPFMHARTHEEGQKSLLRNIKIMEEFIKKHPKDLRILYYLTHDNFHLNNYKETIKWCEKYIQANPKDSYKINKIFTRIALCQKKLGDGLSAIDSLLLAITAAPELIEPYLYLGDIYMSARKYKEAVHFYKIANLCKMPDNINQYFNSAAYAYFSDLSLAYSLPKIEEYKNALVHAKKVLKYIPKDKKLISHIKWLESH